MTAQPLVLRAIAVCSLCVFATSSYPAISTSGPFDFGGGELFVTVYDASAGVTYTRDLGVVANTFFLNNNDLSFAPDALYLATFADSDPADLRYSVVSVENFDALTGILIRTTSNSEVVEFLTPPQQIYSAVLNAITDFTAATNLAAGSMDPAENLSSVITEATSDGFYTNPSTFNETLGSVVAFNTGAPVTEALAFHAFSDFVGGPTTYSLFDRQWRLAADGTLTYQIESGLDSDGDGVDDTVDNCVETPNPAQVDSNADGFGNQCDTDLNDDCVTNFIDLGLLRIVFFSADSAADFNVDGTVNFGDLGVMRAQFLTMPGPSAVATCL